MDMTDVVDILPALQDKAAVTLISRLSATRDHIKVQKAREGFFSELVDFINGTGARRQRQINQGFADLLEVTVDQLSCVMDSVALGHRAIDAVSIELKNLQSHTKVLAIEVGYLRDRLDTLANSVAHKMGDLEKQLHRVDARTRAQEQLGRVFDRWNAGLLDSLPLAARCYAVLEELWWGDFGHFQTHHPGAQALQLRQDFRVKAMGAMAKALGLSPRHRVARDAWLGDSMPELSRPTAKRLACGMAFLSEWAEPRRTPFVYSVGSRPLDDTADFPLGFPFLMSAERVATALEREFFVFRGSSCA